ncbi:RNA polymerase II transcription factor B subunit 1 [Neophaeococcomyces mojaviensis]|uniref:RNA polymerase II transcription factor B subunit 1 n=1 Tax=Neophaeococcomyces mojaviensis TaxID=3383035 RepID=A0ACC3A0B1_9EURO|nr:RNA polymerase II transcription factor B subunit 1 [Knufia sp. JES_112]
MAAVSISASTLYKKNEGILAIAKDRRSVSWSPSTPSASAEVLTLDVSGITNLQQTPADKPKVMLKIFVTEPGKTEPVSYVFNFTSKTDARGEANAIRDVLTQAMTKVSQNNLTQASAGQSAAMTIAAAVSGTRGNSWEDDEKLISDVRLQQALLKDNPELQRTFMEARNMKPESLSLIQFTKQFWASRVHLLRAHALAQSQSKGQYNVFSEIKKSEGGTILNLTSEHIKAIFEQYAIMRIVYDEVVPKKIKDERDFWSRFFQSQLFSALRGLKFDRRTEARDAVLDQYLDHPELTGVRPTAPELHIPKFIDLEGNEVNHSQRQGNLPDAENRQTSLDKGPIIRRLNAISEKLMAAVKPSDADVSAPIGIDEHEFEQLRLRDLSAHEAQQHIALNIRDQSHIFNNNQTTSEDSDIAQIRALNPSKAIQRVTRDLENHYSPTAKPRVIDIDLDEDDEDDQVAENGDTSATKPVSGITIASNHITGLITAHRDQTTDSPTNTVSDPNKPPRGLSQDIYDRLKLTHSTTLEFLRQFWSAFLSGDPGRVSEIASLVESLNNALTRINSIATDAQTERNDRIKKLQEQANEIFQKTGKRRRVDVKNIGGGEAVVKELLGPCMKGLAIAVQKYRDAYDQQSKDLGADGG